MEIENLQDPLDFRKNQDAEIKEFFSQSLAECGIDPNDENVSEKFGKWWKKKIGYSLYEEGNGRDLKNDELFKMKSVDKLENPNEFNTIPESYSDIVDAYVDSNRILVQSTRIVDDFPRDRKSALGNEHLNMKIYYKNESDIKFTRDEYDDAAKNGDLEKLKQARENKFSLDEWTCACAAENGHLEVLKWARENGCPWNESTCDYATKNGHMEVLKWAHENGCPWNERICANIALNGDLETLKWARENGCSWDESTCAYAAKNGHLEVLKWAHENGCPWDERTCAYAAENGHLEILKWARENECPLDKWMAFVLAFNNKQSKVIDWIKENDNFVSSMDKDLEEVLEWVKEEGIYNSHIIKNIINKAVKCFNVKVLKWAEKNGYI